MSSLEDLQQRVALLEGQFEALATIAPGLERVLLMRDVNVGLITPIAQGEALVWDTTQHGFVNAPAGGVRKMGYYDDGFSTLTPATGSFSGLVDWPTLALGDALLDLSTPNAPTVTEDGFYTISATVANSDSTGVPWRATLGANPAAGAVEVNAINAVVSSGFSPPQRMSLSLTVPLLAGDPLAVNCATSGTLNLSLRAVVSKIG